MTLSMLAPADFQPRAEALFHHWRQQLEALIDGARAEHVGASSIPGAWSKGDLDICLLVPPAQLETAVATLRAAGFEEKPGTLRSPELCMMLAPQPDFDVAVQVVALGSQFEFFLHFRDALTAAPALVERYNQIKRDTAHLPAEAYREAKAAFIDEVLSAGIKAPAPSAGRRSR